jgi:alpha-galactosidase
VVLTDARCSLCTPQRQQQSCRLPAMARAPSSSSSLVLVLVVVAAAAVTASEAIRVPAAGNWTEELRGAATRRARHRWRSRRRALENGLGRTPQWGMYNNIHSSSLLPVLLYPLRAITAVHVLFFPGCFFAAPSAC